VLEAIDQPVEKPAESRSGKRPRQNKGMGEAWV
jgi:hypothetical protein